MTKPIYTDRHDFERHCADEIIDAIKAGESVRCEGYTIDAADYAHYLSERDDYTPMLMDLVLEGRGDEFQEWAERQLEAYADRHAGARADYLEAYASGALAAERAEYDRDCMEER